MATEPVQRRVEELSTRYMTGQLSRRRFVAGLVGLGSEPAARQRDPRGLLELGVFGSPAAERAGWHWSRRMAALLARRQGRGHALSHRASRPSGPTTRASSTSGTSSPASSATASRPRASTPRARSSTRSRTPASPTWATWVCPSDRTAKSGGLVQNYKHAHWDDVDASLKDADGAYCTGYYGAESFVINTDAVKIDIKDWKDLLDPSLKNAVGIDGDPNKASDSFNAVWSAAFANGGGVDDIGPGVDWFKQLQAAGNLTPARCTQAALQSGEVKVGIKWDYLGLGDRDKFAGAPNIKVVIPPSGSVTGPYVAIVAAKAPHPNAAKLWNEQMFSDAGQLQFLKGYARPARYDKLVAAGKVPADLAAKLPSPDSYKNVKFITDAAKIDAAKTKLASLWNIVVNS